MSACRTRSMHFGWKTFINEIMDKSRTRVCSVTFKISIDSLSVLNKNYLRDKKL